MKILVTGGAGFIGSHVVDTFIAAGHDVAIVDNFWSEGGAKEENVNPKARLYRIDIRDKALAEVFDAEKPEVVSHHAAQHSVKISADDPAFDADVNVLGLINLLNNCVRTGTRKVIMAGSGASFGSPTSLPLSEASPQRPESPYGITKMVCEHYYRFYRDTHGLDFTVLRYGNAYGPRQDPHGEAGVIAIFSKLILNNEGVRIDWDGNQEKDYVFALDCARANLLALDRAGGECLCIATGRGTSVNELYHRLCDIVGNEVPIRRAPKRPGDIYQQYFDCTRAREVLGWEPQIDINTGLEQTVAFFREQMA